MRKIIAHVTKEMAAASNLSHEYRRNNFVDQMAKAAVVRSDPKQEKGEAPEKGAA